MGRPQGGKGLNMAITNDVTFQSSGRLVVSLKCDWNVNVIRNYRSNDPRNAGLKIAFDKLAYVPANEPPPPWSKDKQYACVDDTVFGFMGAWANADILVAAGVLAPVVIRDMSSHSVANDKGYWFTFNCGDLEVRLSFIVFGVPGGSILKPGFGVFNLATNPNAWSYLYPDQFSGRWMIGFDVAQSQTPMWLSLDYAPPKIYGSSMLPEARLNYTIAGSYLWGEIPEPDKPATAPGTPPATLGLKHLHGRGGLQAT
jgi:hypothetical protein